MLLQLWSALGPQVEIADRQQSLVVAPLVPRWRVVMLQPLAVPRGLPVSCARLAPLRSLCNNINRQPRHLLLDLLPLLKLDRHHRDCGL